MNQCSWKPPYFASLKFSSQPLATNSRRFLFNDQVESLPNAKFIPRLQIRLIEHRDRLSRSRGHEQRVQEVVQSLGILCGRNQVADRVRKRVDEIRARHCVFGISAVHRVHVPVAHLLQAVVQAGVQGEIGEADVGKVAGLHCGTLCFGLLRKAALASGGRFG